MENLKKIVNFLFELCGAKTICRSGWQRIGIKDPESLADHALLSAQIAYILALMEKADPDRAASLALFADRARTRTGDANWVSRIYSPQSESEEKAADSQVSGLPIAEQMSSIFQELKDQKTKEAIVARDADYLDLAIQSKYYADDGNKKALLYLESAGADLKTESARNIFTVIKETGIEEWWMEMEEIKKKFEKIRS